MDVTIRFCRTCGFREPAEAIAAALQNEFGLQIHLEEAFWGTFQILHGEVEIYNRWKTRGFLGRLGLGRTPAPDEIVALFRPRLEPVAANSV